jgi:hypothetical protein
MSINWPMLPGTIFPAGPPGTPGQVGPIGIGGPQGPIGPGGVAGPSAWAPTVPWAPFTSYTATPPASTVTNGGSLYVCNISHVSAEAFSATNWTLSITSGGPPGPTGPAPFGPPTAWAASTSYSAAAPASEVTYLGSLYVCTTSHVSTSTFDATKWTSVNVGAAGATGATGATGAAGPAPWQTPTPWAASTSYTATAPASSVTYGGSFYVCTVSHTSTTTFNAANWVLVTVITTGGAGTTQVIASGNVTVAVTDSYIILNKTPPQATAITLPAVTTFTQPWLLIVDWNGNAGDITLSGALINGQPTWVVGSSPTSPGSIQLWPSSLGYLVH